MTLYLATILGKAATMDACRRVCRSVYNWTFGAFLPARIDAFFVNTPPVEIPPTNNVQDKGSPRRVRPVSISSDLSRNTLEHIENAFTKQAKPSSDQIEASQLSFNIAGKVSYLGAADFSKLEADGWFNDNIIDCCMQIIQERSCRIRSYPSCLAFSAFHLPRIQNNSYIREEALELDSYDLLAFPVNVDASGAGRGNHWVMVIIDNRTREILTTDSLTPDTPVQEAEEIRDWFVGYLIEQGKEESAHHYRSAQIRAMPVPRQCNGSDCGPATIKALEWASRGCDPTSEEYCDESYTSYRLLIQQTLRACGSPQGSEKDKNKVEGSPKDRKKRPEPPFSPVYSRKAAKLEPQRKRKKKRSS